MKYNVLDNSNRDFVKEEMEENTTPFYRAPEYIELYSGYPIKESVDIFALGVLMEANTLPSLMKVRSVVGRDLELRVSNGVFILLILLSFQR